MTRTRRNKHRYRSNHRNTDDLPEWLTTKLAAAMTRWQAGQFDSCPHNPTFRSNIPVRMVAWNPRLITCPGCAHLAMLPASDPENFRCDGCGGTDDELHMGQLTMDRVTFTYGVCADCRAAMN